MDELYPEPSEELIGRQILIMNNAGLDHLHKGQVVTVAGFEVGLLRILELNGARWYCSDNDRMKLFTVVSDLTDPAFMEGIEPGMGPVMKSIFYNLNKLA